MSGEYRCHIKHKQLKRSHYIKLLPFLPVTSHGQKVLNFGVSMGVWRVSGRCLEGVWVTLDTVWRVIMPNQLTKVQKASF